MDSGVSVGTGECERVCDHKIDDAVGGETTVPARLALGSLGLPVAAWNSQLAASSNRLVSREVMRARMPPRSLRIISTISVSGSSFF